MVHFYLNHESTDDTQTCDVPPEVFKAELEDLLKECERELAWIIGSECKPISIDSYETRMQLLVEQIAKYAEEDHEQIADRRPLPKAN